MALNLFWVALGLAIVWQALPLGLIGPAGPASGLFPLLAGLLVAGSGTGLLVAGTLRHDVASAEQRAPAASGAAFRIGGTVAVVALMIAVVPYLGFVLAGVLGLPMLFLIISPAASWWLAILVGLIASAAVHLLFGVLLGTPLPHGPWGF